MILSLTEYIADVQKDGASAHTIEAYKRALERTGVNQVDTERLPELYKVLLTKLEAGVSYVYIKHVMAMLFAYFKIHTDESPFKGKSYHDLYKAIQRLEKPREEYADDEIKKLFRAAAKINDGRNTWRAAALCYYSGLRISGCKGIRWDSVKPVDGTNCVTFRVWSKNKEYSGILSNEVFEAIKRFTDPSNKNNQTPYIVNDHSSKSSPFDKLYRTRLTRALSTECPEIISKVEELEDGKKILHRKSPFHSLRKSFAHKLESAGIDVQDLRYLMNHTPVGVTFSHYIFTEKGKQPIDLVKRMALAYQKCEPLMTPDLLFGEAPKRAVDQWNKEGQA
ncbi:tyrosine-type recombinase/integrase [Candidatus Nitrososphaera evergladensis]|nr:site-specific integrase [Candidatus Nitrososphaera evergladensis]